MPVREVAFELECFEWADERLEVAGRWKGLTGRRLNRPVLTVETEGGRRKHLVALPGGTFGSADDTWRAAFDWPGDPGEITGAELEVGGNVVVDLPLPDRKRRRRRKPSQQDSGADEALRAEIGALRGQIERLRAELAGRERENMQLRRQIPDDDPEDEPLVSGAHDATVELRQPAGEQHAELEAELERLQAEREQTRADLSAEVERLQAEREEMRARIEQLERDHAHALADLDDLRESFSEAAAEAEEVRDRHRGEVAELQDELRAERATVARLTAELAAGPELPPPATPSAVQRLRGSGSAPAPAPGTTEEREAAAAPPTQPITPVPADQTEHPDEDPPGLADAAAVPGVLDPPGPLRAGARPSAQPGVEDGVKPSRVPAWLRAARGPRDEEELDEGDAAEQRHGGAPLQVLKERFEGLFSPSNGNGTATREDAADEEEDLVEIEPVPAPRRSAAAARARAGATVAARRSPAELWAARIAAIVLVALLLIAFLILLTSVA